MKPAASRTVVLAGAGHVHLQVAAQAEALAERGARVVLVDPGEFWYSGLATGMLGGSSEPAAVQVNARALIQAHGGEFIQDQAQSLDPISRRLRLVGGGELAYDFLSINVGSQVDRATLPGAQLDPSVWSVKPISNLWKLREHLESRFQVGMTPRVAVIGGGPTGSELAANLRALGARRTVDLPVTLLAHSDRLIPQAPAGAARWLQRTLTRRGIEIRTGTRIVRRQEDTLIAEDGSRVEADVVVLATGLVAHPFVFETGLPTRPRQGLRVNAKLHSIADQRVFAGGDCASMEGFDLPKLGVFGVRQAVCIQANLLASLAGEPLREYQPQRRFLAILNLGDGIALSTWGPLWWSGRASLWLKDRIDRRFLAGYR